MSPRNVHILCFGFNLGPGALALVSSASGMLNGIANVLEQIWN